MDNDMEHLTQDELNRYFELDGRVRSRVREVAIICTNICSVEEIERVYEDNNDICVRVWSSGCGHDRYEFPRQYLFMSDAEIKADLDRKQKEFEQRLKEEEKAEKKRALEREKREYERLKKKFEKGKSTTATPKQEPQS